MNKYRFELEPVLEIRENIERKCQAELAEVRSILRNNLEALEELNNIKEDTHRDFLNIQQNITNPQECINYYEYLRNLKIKIDKQLQDIERIKQEEKTRRELLEEASRNKLVVEELKKQDYKDFGDRVNKLEQKMVDEMTTISYNLDRYSKQK